MAALIQPEECSVAEYCGIGSIFEYINGDGSLRKTNCGLAAAATLLTFHHKLPPDLEEPKARRVMADLERWHPPDNLGGLFGTSRRLVTRICKAFGLRVLPIKGEQALRKQLDDRNPVVVMLGVSGGKLLGFELPAGHWMVAYGYDHDHVFLTNWGRMTWREFHHGWTAFVPRLIGMRNRGLAALRKSANDLNS